MQPSAARHVLTILAVEDLARAKAFYEAAFGWERLVDVPVYVELAVPGGMRLGLYARDGFAHNTGQAPAPTPAGAITPTELYLWVDDLDGALERMTGAGARLLSARAARDWGDEAAYFADPDGNVVVLARPLRAVVIFACVHNAGRSQMAAGLFTALADPTRATAVSAGTQPAARVHAEVVTAMAEVGIDLSRASPRLLTDALARGAALLVTMGCGEACPAVPGLERTDWPLSDPKGQSLEEVRRIRDQVRARVEALVAERGWRRPG